jgi:UDP-N-acetylmuramoyl-L-alanyl-D-glutamate--2,6-diaminopimelate ligase
MDGIKYTINLYDKICKIQFGLPGLFNMYNTMAAAAAARFLGADVKAIAKGIAHIKRVDGRFDIIKTKKGVNAVVDYAHTPDGVKNILSALSEIKGGKKIITVFGCGGNRDKSKRRLMGEVAYGLSDFLVITSDNPRFETPMDIINDIISPSFEDTKYIREENRARAIEYAINKAQGGDIVAILGKGAETYQEIGGIRRPYNDYEIVGRF